MPRVRRTPRVRKGWPPGAVMHLLTGWDFFNDGFGRGDDFDEASAEAAWFELRDRVEVALVEKRRSCGGEYLRLRPAAWWWFSSPEARDCSMTEAEQLDRLGLSYEVGEVPIHDGSNNGKLVR